MAEVAFALMALEAARLRELPHHTLVFMVGLGVVGLVVAHQVQRVRALSRYYENRPTLGT
jgi:hypothetical protein